MNRQNSIPRNKNQGFTLVELMLAVVLGSIVMLGSSVLLTGYWRANNRFLNQQVTINELKLFATAFQKEVRENIRTSGDVADFVEFTYDDGSTSSFSYDVDRDSIIYTMSNGNEMEMLPDSAVSGFSIEEIPGTTALKITVEVEEEDLNNIRNQYTLIATMR